MGVCGVMVLAACGGDGGGGSTDPGNTGQFKFTAKIDGTSWASTGGVERAGVPITLPGLYVLTGTNLSGGTAYTIVISLYNISGPGTYPLGVGVSVPGGNVLVSSLAGGWRTPQTGADGTITITTLTPSRIEGTFSFTAVAFTGGATGTKTVTDGAFVLEVKPTGTVGPLPDNAGSKVTATLNGAAYNAADVASTFIPSSGILTIVGNNSARSVTISLAGIPAAGVGTYALSNGSPTRTLGVTVLNGTQVAGLYSSSVGGGSGSVTISSLTATRIKGTFTATLGAAGSGATGTMTVANGTFDVGRQQ
jgi:hypothetical protein